MKPTIIGSSPKNPAQGLATTSPASIETGAIVLRSEQIPAAEKALSALDFAQMPASDIIKIGMDAEQALQRNLDSFLARLDKKTAVSVFALFGRLEQGVEDAKLPEILDKIQNGEKPGMLGSLIGRLRGKRPDELISDLLAEIGDLISGRTKTLADVLTKLETELSAEMQRLFAELQALDLLKKSYATHFNDFTISAAVSRALLERARTYVSDVETNLNPADMVAQARLGELRDKLRLLESRSLALEGTYTRLPADALVIQQIEQAGITTLQETATTVASRFASIKMTLLSLHGAFAVKSVQQLSSRQAKLDRQLTDIRGSALKDVAVTAALAPGDNRLAQARQIEQIIATTNEVHAMVSAAKKVTEEKFEQARQSFATARQELASLSSK